MTDPLQTTQKGYWLVDGARHSTLPEAFQDAGNRAQESPGTVVTVTPPTFEVVYTPPSPPPTDPIPTAPTVTGQTLTADKTEIHVGDTFTVSAVLDYSDGSTKPVGSYRLYGYDAGVVSTPAPSRTTFTAKAVGTTTIRNDFSNTTGKLAVTVLAADAPPSDPPADPPPSGPPPSDPPDDPVDPPPSDSAPIEPLPPASGDGTHQVRAIHDDETTGVRWTALAAVGEDYTVPAEPQHLRDADGNPHPALMLYAYADCCDVGAVLASATQDYAGSLRIDYDDAKVYDAQLVQFYRGCLNKTIRYGVHQPVWHPVDPDLFPDYKTPSTPLALEDLTRYDWSYNGMGLATTRAMGTTGAREDIGYVPGWDVPFLVQPSDDSYAVVRKAADHAGAWPIYFADPDTGHILDVTKYPNASMEAYTQGNFKNNPIAEFSNRSKITGSPLLWDEAHQTGYAFVAAAATGSARDKFHASFHGNAPLIAANPSWHGSTGWWVHAQTRGAAWGNRSAFLAAHVSDKPDYFAARLDNSRIGGEKVLTHPLGLIDTRPIRTFHDGSKGVAVWECAFNYLVAGVIARKHPEWATLRDRFKGFLTGGFSRNYWLLVGTSSLATHDPQGNQIATWDDCIRHTLTGDWSDADIATALDPATTPEQVGQLIYDNWHRKFPAWIGKVGDFNEKYPQDSGGHCANLMASVATLCGDGPEWAKCQSVPTQPWWSQGWGWNIVPRAA